VTSHCHSPTLGHLIAMAMLKDGRTRIGEQVVIRDHTRNIEAVCEVCTTVHLDPEGAKLRG
jgi:glycine cleavage system aminomethyltransferase T